MKISNKTNIEDILTLTPTQEGMLFHYLKDPGSEVYFEQLSLEISGEIDPQVFENAWNFVIEVNEMLRTVFRWEKVEKPVQMVLREHKLKPKYYNIPGTNPGQIEAYLEEIKAKDKEEKFDLREVPFRVSLCRRAEDQYVMIISSHHILYDGWSNGIILKEFFLAYETLIKGNHSLIPRVKPRFKEFIRWHQEQDRQEQKKSWQNYLEGFDSPTRLPNKKSGPGPGIPGGRNYRLHLTRAEKDKLEGFVKEKRITLAAVFYCAWGLLLQRYCGSEDVVFGITVSGRSASIQGIEDMVGLFINTIPLRAGFEPGENLPGFLVKINNHLAAGEKYESTSLVDIYSCCRVTQIGVELFDTLVSMENYPLDTYLREPGTHLSIRSYAMEEMPHYDLTLVISAAEGIDIDFIYNNTAFDKESIARLARHFDALLKGIVENVGTRPPEIEILSAEEKQQLLVDFNRTAADYPKEKTIYELFEENAEKRPYQVALVGPKAEAKKRRREEEKKVEESFGQINAFGGEAVPVEDSAIPVRPVQQVRPVRPVQLTYRELNERSDRLAGLLIEEGVQPDMIVGIMMERSVEMVIGILGILKSGGAYMPIDPGYPQERIDYMLKDSNTNILVSDHLPPAAKNLFEKRFPDFQKLFVNEKFFAPLFCKKAGRRRHYISAKQTAYIIYTSGSTGKPKGVMVEQGPVVNLLFALQQRYPLRVQDTYLFKTSYLFDVSVTELFGWFFEGGRLAILPPGEEKDPTAILEMIAREGVTHINFVPSMFHAFVEILNSRDIFKLTGLKYIFLAGEALPVGPVNRFRRFNTSIALENIYGPTEAAVYASWYSLAEGNGEASIPIGKPLPNVTLYILDQWGYLQPIGVPGELCISGVGIARGYLNQPELTFERFINYKLQITNYKQNTNPKLQITNKEVPFGQILNAFGEATTHHSPLTIHHSPLYRTGDLARWLLDGNIEFLGRMDFQVKVRGFRIELGEIESLLLNHPGVKETVVTAQTDRNKDFFLCAYVVSFQELPIDLSLLKDYLQQKLPHYMIPAYFVSLEALPLTSSGKIDRASLPLPGLKSVEKYIPPANELEMGLVNIWSGLLGIDSDQIGIDDNFFELGGHSLKATLLISRIRKTFEINVPLSGIFKRPTIRLLSEYVVNAGKDRRGTINPLEHLEKKEYYPLSSAQKRVYFLQQTDEASLAYHLSSIWVWKGAVDREKLTGIFKTLIQRHESLRTAFSLVKEEIVQRIHTKVDFSIEFYDRTAGDSGRIGAFHYFFRPFHLSWAPLLRVGLVKQEETKYLFMVDTHHIIADGTSVDILVKEFMALYNNEGLPRLELQYKEYCHWQYKKKKEDTIQWQKQENFWQQEFAGEIPVLELPLDFPRSNPPTFKGDLLRFSLEEADTHKLDLLASAHGATLYMVSMAIFNIFLARLCQQEDIVVGTVTQGRDLPGFRPIVGMFVNTLALRNFPIGEKPFTAFLKEVKEKTLAAFDNQDYQLEKLMEDLKINTALFTVMMAMANPGTGGAELDIPGLPLERYPYEPKTAKFDLTLIGVEVRHRVQFSLEYSTDLFKAETVQRYVRFFNNTVTSVLENPQKTISAIEIISEEEKKRVLYEFNHTGESYPGIGTLYELFMEQVWITPEKIALVGHAEINKETIQLTYKVLKEKASGLAAILKGQGVCCDAMVGIKAERSIEMMIGVLGILKAGGGYLPIDPDYPRDRIDFMMKDSGAKWLLTTHDITKEGEKVRRWEGEFKESSNFSLVIDNWQLAIDNSKFSTEFPGLKNEWSMRRWYRGFLPSYLQCPSNLSGHWPPGTSLAYVIYTSGSTGKPKGVMVNQESVVNLVLSQKHRFNIDASDRILQFSSLCFDASVEQIFLAFFSGAALVLVDKNTLLDTDRFEKFMINQAITHLHAVPSFLNNINPDPHRHLKRVIAGGDVCPVSLAHRWSRYCDFYNEYGPTETTVTSIEIRYGGVGSVNMDWARLPVGKPIANTGAYLLDRWQKPVPVGLVGELYIGGAGVARGYLNRPELTAEKFVISHVSKKFKRAVISPSTNDQCPVTNDRLYKTGDLARWLSDGNIEFLSRSDHQVKIRGFRIELGEIETRLLHYKRNARPETVTHCKSCLLSDNYPGIRFDEEGICNICREYEEFKDKAHKYFQDLDGFKTLMEKAVREKSSPYDCMLLFSGGKDSSYVLYRLVEMGFKVLAFTFDNGYISTAALENIKRITSKLKVDSVVYKIENMKEIFLESLNQDHTVCSGCFKALTTASTQLAVKKKINVIVTGLSRGQIFDTKLYGLFKQNIFDPAEIDEQLVLFRKMYHHTPDKMSKLLNIPLEDEIFKEIYFVDFSRYDNTPLEKIKEYLQEKDTHWSKPGDTGFCSTNCIINDTGIYVHWQERGYHNYAAPLSWMYRLGQGKREEFLEEIKFEVDEGKAHGILKEIGYREEPIREVVVVDGQDEQGEKYLSAYFVSDREIEGAELRKWLGLALPGYMIPSYFIRLEQMPLTSSGKLDRKALPRPGVNAGRQDKEPLNKNETKLAELWAEILGIHREIPRRDSNFFELGGHSLKATLLVLKIRKVFDVSVAINEIFMNPTLGGIAEIIDHKQEEKFTPLRKAEEKEYYPLSFPQQRFYILQNLDRENVNYNLPMVLEFQGNMDRQKLENALRGLIRRHEILRTSFHLSGGKPVQHVQPAMEFSLEYYPGMSDRYSLLEPTAIIKNFIRPFRLSQPPLLRAGLIELEPQRHFLVIDFHHIVTDGISSGILAHEFTRLYEGEQLPPQLFQYRDFVEWQNTLRQRTRIEEQEKYWLKQFERELPLLELPTDYPRPRIKNFAGNTYRFEIAAQETGRLNRLAAEAHTSLYMVLLAVYYVLLFKLGGQEDIIVGTGVSGRGHAELTGIIGVFFTTIPLRHHPAGSKNFASFIEEITANTLEAFENSDFPLNRLVELLVQQSKLRRDPGRNPLFDTMFAMQNFQEKSAPIMAVEMPGLTIKPYPFYNEISRFDLFLMGTEIHDTIAMELEYAAALFKPGTAEKMAGAYLEIIDQVLENPQITLREISTSYRSMEVESRTDREEYMEFDF